MAEIDGPWEPPMPALPWLLGACDKAGKGAIQNMDARAVLRAVKEAERAAVQADRDRICAALASEKSPLEYADNSWNQAIDRAIAVTRGKEQDPA